MNHMHNEVLPVKLASILARFIVSCYVVEIDSEERASRNS